MAQMNSRTVEVKALCEMPRQLSIRRKGFHLQVRSPSCGKSSSKSDMIKVPCKGNYFRSSERMPHTSSNPIDSKQRS